MSKSSLTKIITFTPFYLVHNTTEHVIQIRELETDEDCLLDIGPGQMAPFWPLYGGQQVVANIKGTINLTSPFTLADVHSSLLMLGNRFGGLHVDVRTSASETLVTMSIYKRGLAPVRTKT